MNKQDITPVEQELRDKLAAGMSEDYVLEVQVRQAAKILSLTGANSAGRAASIEELQQRVPVWRLTRSSMTRKQTSFFKRLWAALSGC